MFINDQYLFNQAFYWPYQREMELDYFAYGVYDADILMVMLVGA